jgi:O-antigen ligase
MSQKEKLFLALILLFFFTLFFPKLTLLTIIAAVAVVGCGLWFSPVKEKMQVLRQRRHLQGMLLFFAWIVVSVLLSENFNNGLSFLDPRLALFYFPLCIGTLQVRSHFRNAVLLGLAVITTAMGAVCLINGLDRSDFFQKPEFLYNDSLTEILGQQSIYIALLVNFSIYIFSYFVLFTKARYRGGMIVAVLFLFGISYLLASRIMMATLLVVAIGFCFYYTFSRGKYLEGATLLFALLMGGFAIYKMFPQTLNRFKELTYTQFNYQSTGKESHYNMQLDSTQWNGANFRMAAWRCGWKLFRQHPVLGVGLGDKKTELFAVYKQKQFHFAIRTNKNVHNNYLDILYSMGLIGGVLFFAGWIVLPIRNALQYGDGLSALIMLTFAAAWVTEIYFDRNLGGMLTGFIIPFLLTDKTTRRNKSI